MQSWSEIQMTESRGAMVVVLRGEAEDAAAGRLLGELLMQEGLSRLVLDLSELTSIARTGIGVLLQAQALLIGYGATMAVARPQPAVADVLAGTGADQLIPVYGTVREAVTGPAELQALC